jgi:hypothetical protein
MHVVKIMQSHPLHYFRHHPENTAFHLEFSIVEMRMARGLQL